MDREAWHAAILGVTKSWTRLNDWPELKPRQTKFFPSMEVYICPYYVIYPMTLLLFVDIHVASTSMWALWGLAVCRGLFYPLHCLPEQLSFWIDHHNQSSCPEEAAHQALNHLEATMAVGALSRTAWMPSVGLCPNAWTVAHTAQTRGFKRVVDFRTGWGGKLDIEWLLRNINSANNILYFIWSKAPWIVRHIPISEVKRYTF